MIYFLKMTMGPVGSRNGITSVYKIPERIRLTDSIL